MPYNPHKEITHHRELGGLIMLTIVRQPEDDGADWHDSYRLIENVLCHDEEVANCAVDPHHQKIYVALTGDI